MNSACGLSKFKKIQIGEVLIISNVFQLFSVNHSTLVHHDSTMLLRNLDAAKYLPMKRSKNLSERIYSHPEGKLEVKATPHLSNLHIKRTEVLMSQISNTLQECITAFRTILLCLETVCEEEEADIGSHKPPESHSSDIAKDDLFKMKIWAGVGSSMKLTQESHKHVRYHIL